MPTKTAESKAPVMSRRDRVRVETTAEIKQRALAEMREHGLESLSMREVSRQMGMSASALYRYFASRTDLLSALIVDGFDSLATALEAAYTEAQDLPSAVDVCLAVGHAHRAWALENPTAYKLIYASALPDYRGTPETTAAAGRAVGVLMRVMVDLVDQDLIDLPRIEAETSADLTAQLSEWEDAGAEQVPLAARAAAMRWWATLHGLIHLEMNEQFPSSLMHSAALFESVLRAATTGLGRPAQAS